MRKAFLVILICSVFCVLHLSAQTENDPIPIVSWKISERLGNITPTPFDTIILNFQNRTIPDGFSTAYGYTGNLMQPGQSKIFFDRPLEDRFIFKDGFYPFIKRPGNFDFTNTKIPYSNLTYTWGGGNTNKEERLTGIFSANVNKKWNLGGYFDYVYARGFYENQAAKQTDFVFFTNYLSDKYVLHAFIGADNINNQENGGIENDTDITNPEDANGSKRKIGSKEIPVRLSNYGNRIKDRQLFLNHRYNIGFYREISDSTAGVPINQIDALSSDLTVKGKVFESEEDSLGSIYRPTERTMEFVPVTSFIHTVKYTYDSRFFNGSNIPANYFPDPILNNTATHDSTKYFALRNTFGISLLEGFNQYAKAGLSVFIENEIRNYRLIEKQDIDLIDYFPEIRDNRESNTMWNSVYKENATYVGAELSKRQGTLLTYDLRGELGILGDDIGQFKISGNAQTTFRLWKDIIRLNAYGHIYNLVPTFYQRKYHSNFFWWENNFHDQRRVRVGGIFSVPTRGFQLDIGVENLQNYIYFNEMAVPDQTSENIQVFSAKLNQNFTLGVLHWDNEIVYQTTSNKEILPLPALSLYSNAYLWFTAARVLRVQLGADVRYHTNYYAPAYQPATSQFYLQKEVEIGNYPLVNAYINLYLKKTRFFLMAYHINQGSGRYFSLPHYPINPFHLRFGISASFND